MGSTYSQAKLLKRRVRQVQSRAKAAGIVYMLGTAMLLLCAACILGVAGTCLHANNSGGIVLPVLTFYLPVVEIVTGKRAWSAQAVLDCTVIAAYALLLLMIAVSFLYCLSKLNWLFKRRASYVNGFNRNMYAMDAMAKCYSLSLIATILCMVLMMLASNATMASMNMYGYAVLGAGIGVHFVGGLMSGRVTLFTMGKRIQEEERPNGLGMHVVRNVLQMGAAIWVAFLLLQQNRLYTVAVSALSIVFPAEGVSFDWATLVPAIAELAAWVGLALMFVYACSVKEFDREGMCAYGIQRFTAFALIAFAALLAMLNWPLPDATAVQSLNQNHVLAAAVVGIACLLNWILRVPANGSDEEVDVKTLIEESEDD